MKLASRVEQIKPSVTLSITAKAKAMKASGINVISFGAGEPDFDTPVYIKDAAKAAIDKGKTKYTPSIGTPDLRKAICEDLKKYNNLDYTLEQIIVSNGAKHSLYNIFQAICDKGDEVIIPSPFWVSYPEMVGIAGAKPVMVSFKQQDGFKANAEAIKNAVTKKTKAIVLNSPNNPTGAVYNREALEKIADIAVKNNIIVISDEIYKRLIYDGAKHVSIASLNDKIKKLTIVVDGVSKTYSMTGWRIGYLASEDNALIKAINNLQDHSTSNPSSISQEAALSALKTDDGSVEKMRAEFEKRRNYMVEKVNSIKGLSCVKPEGAFYCFCDISKTKVKSLEFVEKLLKEANTAAIPGEAFGWPTHIRLSYAMSMEDIKEGLNRIERFTTQYYG